MEEVRPGNYTSPDNSSVKHEGVISKISDDTITVSLKGNINCEACNAKSICGVSESGSKQIEIHNTSESLKLNDNVMLLLKKNLGLKAVFWAYVFPFILLLSVLLMASNYFEEWIAGLLAMAILIPYYALLYVLRTTFRKEFKVSILKTSL